MSSITSTSSTFNSDIFFSKKGIVSLGVLSVLSIISLKVFNQFKFQHSSKLVKQNSLEIGSAISRMSEEIAKNKETDTGNIISFEQGKYQVFAVHKNGQRGLDFETVRNKILDTLGLKKNTKIIQIIGSCEPFSIKGTTIAKAYLYPKLNREDAMVLWGFTGNMKEQGKRQDINHLVNAWIDEKPSRAMKSLANVVDTHSVAALKEWGCTAPVNARNFYLVYGNAKFGDDIISSDYLTDEGFCLEGGGQSFGQMINFMLRDIPIAGLYGLRVENDPINYDEKNKKFIVYFSAAEFLHLLDKYIKAVEASGSPVTAKTINEFKDEYFKTRHLFDPRRKDAETKTALFNSAWELFISNELWKKLHLCSFSKAETANQ